jgi:hypothetical protein
MPTDLLRGSVVGAALPKIFFGYQEPRPRIGGLLKELETLSFVVTAPGGGVHTPSTPVDVSTDLLAPGVYFAAFTTALGDALGTYTVTWTFTIDGGAPQTGTTKFRLLDEQYPLAEGYVQVEDMIAEGVPVQPGVATGFTGARLVARLDKASRFVEDFTHRIFCPTVMQLALDGRGGRMKQMEQPIVAIGQVEISAGIYESSDGILLDTDLIIYNRHIRQSLRSPDDREDPRIEFFGGPGNYGQRRDGQVSYLNGFQDLPQNIEVDGVFGYTDPDGTAWGKTPEAIKEVVMLIAMQELEGLYTQTDGGTTGSAGGPVVSERTFDQSVEYANLVFAQDGAGSAYAGVITGDPRIDRILAMYSAPPELGSA